MPYTTIANVQIDQQLYTLIKDEIAPGTGIEAEVFFEKLGEIVAEFAPKNRALLHKRDALQKQIDDWCHENRPLEKGAYLAFLKEIGYVEEEGGDFAVSTQNVDPEMAEISGPQLVVPVDKARYALNAANARWGSLYDALYGTDAIDTKGALTRGKEYNPARGEAVFTYCHDFLNKAFPLKASKWGDITGFARVDEAGKVQLAALTQEGEQAPLADAEQCVGYNEDSHGDLTEIVLKNNGLHVILVIDREHMIGKEHKAGIADIILESAITTIQDCEDSVAAVDAADKCQVYRNWNGLMKGDLSCELQKGGKTITRRLNPDREFVAMDGNMLTLPGRSLMLVRNVGMYMYTDAVLDADGNEIPEGFLDAMVTVLSSFHDKGKNSRTGSVYIVKPKMHGPEEVAFNCEVFSAVEDALGLERNRLKIGIMDEEQRTTLNLKECIRAASERVVFINTGFLDRTGDALHTAMHSGALAGKAEMKGAGWMSAYEDHNVNVGLTTGVDKVGQIGKGMYAKPEEMGEMMATKDAHPKAGANCAWVPSPTAATLHALHYHEVNVAEVQEALKSRQAVALEEIVDIPVFSGFASDDEKRSTLEEYCQSILGYVVRWVDQGVGCSSVPNIDDVKLMEDRATLRIGSQMLANWLHHGMISEEEVKAALETVAPKVDEQNAHDEEYSPIGTDFWNNIAMQTSLELVTNGDKVENGYVEYSLSKGRKAVKSGGEQITGRRGAVD